MSVIDLFAGPGGWDLGARALGLDPVGLEFDDAACETRRAAGLRTMQCDVAAVDPHDVVRFVNAQRQAFWSLSVQEGWGNPDSPPDDLDEATCWGLIASPPCQAWSMAGKRGGARDKEHVVRCAGELAAGADTRAEHAAQCEDPRSLLVVEPLRWALALEPEWLAFEQVPPVLELWSMFAQILSLKGYSTWTGVLEAERYGVPQTRERAMLLARRSTGVAPPRPTHQRYVKGEPQRHEHTLDGEVVPWVSMAEALGWGMTERPSVTVAAKKRETGGRRGLGAGSGGERAIANERRRGAWLTDTGNTRGGTRAEGRSRAADEPAATVTSRADQLEWRDRLPGDLALRAGTNENDIVRPATEPAPTLRFGQRSNAVDWVFGRPATTVAGDSRIWPPGHKKNADDERAGRTGYGDRAGTKAVRVTVEEAATLQTFPPDYPWQGNRGQQFTQVGNAVPPLLALHVLSAVTGIAIPAQEDVAA